MSDLWTPNQTPAPCQCVNINRKWDGVTCATCGHPYSPEMLAQFAAVPIYMNPFDPPMSQQALGESVARAIEVAVPLRVPPIPAYRRTNADALRNPGGQERGLIG